MDDKAPRPGGSAEPHRAETQFLGGNDPKISNSTHSKQAAGTRKLKFPDGTFASGPGAEHLAAVMWDMTLAAVALDGARALDCPKSSAAFHESGHAVMSAINGHIPSGVRIWSCTKLGREQWIGMTDGTQQLRVDPGTHQEDDLRHAMMLLAGVVAEMLFDTANYRLGSSINEITLAQSIVHTIAMKRGTKSDLEQQEIWAEILCRTGMVLKPHEPFVRDIADVLMRKERVKPKYLRALLRPIVGRPQ